MSETQDIVDRFSHTHNTCTNIARAILELHPDDADRVWQDPTDDETRAVLRRAWEIADPDETSLCWGVEQFKREAPQGDEPDPEDYAGGGVRRCPRDGGACHHACSAAVACFRRLHGMSLSTPHAGFPCSQCNGTGQYGFAECGQCALREASIRRCEARR